MIEVSECFNELNKEKAAYYLWLKFQHLKDADLFYCISEYIEEEKKKSNEEGQIEILHEVVSALNGPKDRKWWQFWL